MSGVGDVDLIDRDGDRWTETRPDHWHAPEHAHLCMPSCIRLATRARIERQVGPVREVPRATPPREPRSAHDGAHTEGDPR